MKHYQLVGLMVIGIFLIFLTGCNEVDISKLSDQDLERISDKLVECNNPYIRVGTQCCLDQNSNSICDRDEKVEQKGEFKENHKEFEIPVTKTKYDLSDYPSFLIKNNVFDGILVIGDKAPAEDVISILDIAESLKKNKDNPVFVTQPLLDSEINNVKSQNAILVGSPCISKRISELFPNFDPSKCLNDYTYSGIPKGKGVILLIENDGKIQIIVTGESQSNVRSASKILSDYQKHKLDGNLIMVNEDGALDNTENESKQQEVKPTCSDECSTDTCSGFDFISCEIKSDGCKDKINQGIIKGKCNVECITNSHCNQNYECKSYKCVAKPVEVKETQDTESTSKLNALQTCYKRAKECSDNIIGVELEFRVACNDLYLWTQTATEILDFANGLC